MARLKKKYYDTIQKSLKEELQLDNVNAVPKLEKIVVNMGVGDATADSRRVGEAMEEMEKITGQKPVATRSKKSIAQFKLREDMKIGCKVTLRGERMYEFLDRLVTIAMPRIKDFRGVSPKSFDGRGNYSLGLKEQTIFPEIDFDKVTRARGMDITICTTSSDNDHARALLEKLNVPFRK
tara:strand:- start:1006 stop:1545 length:540 start_codon:yes stop_codon:yes gene_type:complete